MPVNRLYILQNSQYPIFNLQVKEGKNSIKAVMRIYNYSMHSNYEYNEYKFTAKNFRHLDEILCSKNSFPSYVDIPYSLDHGVLCDESYKDLNLRTGSNRLIKIDLF